MTPTQIYSVIIYLPAIFLSCPMIIDRFVAHTRAFPRSQEKSMWWDAAVPLAVSLENYLNCHFSPHAFSTSGFYHPSAVISTFALGLKVHGR